MFLHREKRIWGIFPEFGITELTLSILIHYSAGKCWPCPPDYGDRNYIVSVQPITRDWPSHQEEYTTLRQVTVGSNETSSNKILGKNINLIPCDCRPKSVPYNYTGLMEPFKEVTVRLYIDVAFGIAELIEEWVFKEYHQIYIEKLEAILPEGNSAISWRDNRSTLEAPPWGRTNNKV